MARDFDFTDWVDFARGLVGPDRRQLMEAHLASGCPSCARAARLVGELVVAAAHERDYTPPEAAVRLARAIFAERAQSPLSSLPRLIARLVGDTAAQPLPAGVRGSRETGRHALFEVGEYSVDLRIQEDEGTARMQVVGQVLDRRRLSPVALSVPVVLVRGKRVITRAPLNEFGEFRFDCAQQRGLTLQVPVDDGTRRVDVPLTALMPAVRAGSAETGDV